MTSQSPAPGTPPPPILGAHHVAFRCQDAEATRHFYADLLGLELAAALAFDESPGGGPLRYMHLFFRMGDDRFIAFFDLPDNPRPELFRPSSGFNRHIALEVADPSALEAGKARLEQAGLKVEGPIDHGFVQSIYTYDPNGIQVELTCRSATHDAFLAMEGLNARAAVDAWTHHAPA
jgi:catechol 2,3-dioxygenase-like lactoylglutathione lyase family enzyme